MHNAAVPTRLGLAAFVVVCVVAGVARAQRPEDVAAAAAAFREGQTAQLAGDYARAAEAFELADDSSPSAAALRSAIRNRQAAGHAARAATLAAEAITRYPDDTETRTLADAVLTELRPGLGELHLHCAVACSVSIDGRSVNEHPGESFDLFVDAGSHHVVASWAGREPVARDFDAAAGATQTLELEAPELVATTEPDPDPVPPPAPASSGGVSPILFGVGAGLTAVAGGVLIWSGVDVLSARDAYVATPTEAGYRDGLDRETRTNVLIGITGGLAIATVIIAIVTDWDGDGPATTTEANLRPTFVVGESGGALGITGDF